MTVGWLKVESAEADFLFPETDFNPSDRVIDTMRILIAEDDPSVSRFLRQCLAETGYSVEVATDGLRTLELARNSVFELILLDAMMPGMDGFEVCKTLRSEKATTPILFITAKDTLQDKIDGLDAGADDYLVKPFQVRELLARVRALLRRVKPAASSELNVADLTLSLETRKVSREGKIVSLSFTEFRLLEFLMRNVGKTLTRQTILEQVWEYDFGGNDNVLDVYISYLRSKIDQGRETALIHTVRGVGFRFGAKREP